MEAKEERINRLVVEIIILKEENSKLSKQNKTLSDAFSLLNKNYGIMVDDIERLKKENKYKKGCKYVRKYGESCTLNNNCKYPNCE